MGYYTTPWTWYAGFHGDGVFIIPNWAIYIGRNYGELLIDNNSWDNEINQGWLRLATSDDIKRFCTTLYSVKPQVMEIVFQVIFDPPSPVIGEKILYDSRDDGKKTIQVEINRQ